jgi:hypothetical protein
MSFLFQELTRSNVHPVGGQAYLSLDSSDEPFLHGIKFTAMCVAPGLMPAAAACGLLQPGLCHPCWLAAWHALLWNCATSGARWCLCWFCVARTHMQLFSLASTVESAHAVIPCLLQAAHQALPRHGAAERRREDGGGAGAALRDTQVWGCALGHVTPSASLCAGYNRHTCIPRWSLIPLHTSCCMTVTCLMWALLHLPVPSLQLPALPLLCLGRGGRSSGRNQCGELAVTSLVMSAVRAHERQ